MSRALIVLNGVAARSRAKVWIDAAPAGSRVEFKRPKRTLLQNDRMWAMLTEVATQLSWHGRILKTEEWKLVFLSGLRSEMGLIPNFEGDGFIPLRYSSSDLSVEEMSAMIDLIGEYGASRGVVFSK